MKKHIYSLFSVLVVAFVLVSCTGDPLIDPIKDGINSQDYDAAIAAADSAIAQDPGNGLPYFYKAFVLSRTIPAMEDISARQPYYAEMRKNLDAAVARFDTLEKKPQEASQTTNMALSAWSQEHNDGVTYASNDSIMATVSNPLELAIAHLENATTINPDSALSYDVLAQIYYMNSDFGHAAGAMERAIEIYNPGTSTEYDRLASYYMMQDEFDKAVATLETALELYPDSVTLIQKIADSYFQVGQTEEALEVMDKLIQQDPNNAQYRLVIGSQIYQLVLNMADEYSANSDRAFDLDQADGPQATIDSLDAANAALEPRIDELTDQAEEQLLKAAELNDQNPGTFNTLGVLYQNKAAALFDKRNATLDNDEADAFDAAAKEELRKAMTNYEKAAELNPENTAYWEALSRIYTLLDMREKAEEAFEKAGM